MTTDDYMEIAKIEGQSVARFWAEADKIIARRKALMRQLSDLQEKTDTLTERIDKLEVGP
jgi:ubiquinone biosynthesis protein UbiJ